MSCHPRDLPRQRRRRNGTLSIHAAAPGSYFVDHLSESEDSSGLVAGPFPTSEQARREAIRLALRMNAEFR